jgi:peptidoglycan biosynthesis protein MviN/MurJ (putative lipid II flippase)
MAAPENRPRASRLPAVAALLVGSVLLSRVLGFAREAVLAGRLGVSAQMDAYARSVCWPRWWGR